MYNLSNDKCYPNQLCRGGGSSLTPAMNGEGAAGEQGDAAYLTPRPAHPVARKAARLDS